MPNILPRLFFILCLSLVFRAQHLLAQEVKPIKIAPGIYTAEQVINNLNASGYFVNYSPDLLDDQSIQITDTIADLKELLALLVDQNELDSNIKGSTITLSPARQKRFTINGRITDKEDGEALIGVNISLLGTTTGVTTNAYGFYALSLPPGKYRLSYSYIGYHPLVYSIDLQNNVTLNVELVNELQKLDEIVVSGYQDNHEIRGVQPSINQLDMELIGNIPYLMGEVDVFQSALLLPGIRNIGEDASGLNIRGGGVDENLILMDEATIYNSNHFYGLISIFNPDAVKDVTIYKGNVPSTYGGRVSSAIHVRQKEGNDKEFHLSGGLGLVSGRLLAEGPIVKDKSSFLVSARTSFLNYLAALSNNPSIDRSSTNFQDYNAKINWQPDDRNHLYFSTYWGSDSNNDGLLINRQWGNRVANARWNHLFSDKLWSNFTLVYSDYRYEINNPEESGQFIGSSTVRNYTAKSDFTWYLNPAFEFEFGSGLTLHRLNPGDRIPLEDAANNNPVFLDTEHGLEPYVYANIQHQISDRVLLYYGLRYTSMFNLGPDNVLIYEPGMPRSQQTVIDTLSYGRNEASARFYNLEPRFTFNYTLTNRSKIKATFHRATQYIHLISNTVTPAPTDTWKLSDRHIDPSYSNQYTGGYYYMNDQKGLEISGELYYKDIDNIIEYKEGADLFFNENIETEVVQGEARSYGFELLVRKSADRFNGWLSYTLSRTERRVNGVVPEETINEGAFFPADFDRTHDFSASAVYQVNDRWSVSANFIFSTGRPITLPDGKYQYDNIVLPSFSQRNQFRLSDYHRLDISARLEGKKVKSNGQPKKKSDYWVFSIFNAYGRRNAYSYIFRQQEGSEETEVVRYSILGSIIPSVTYNFRF